MRVCLGFPLHTLPLGPFYTSARLPARRCFVLFSLMKWTWTWTWTCQLTCVFFFFWSRATICRVSFFVGSPTSPCVAAVVEIVAPTAAVRQTRDRTEAGLVFLADGLRPGGGAAYCLGTGGRGLLGGGPGHGGI